VEFSNTSKTEGFLSCILLRQSSLDRKFCTKYDKTNRIFCNSVGNSYFYLFRCVLPKQIQTFQRCAFCERYIMLYPIFLWRIRLIMLQLYLIVKNSTREFLRHQKLEVFEVSRQRIWNKRRHNYPNSL